MTSGRRAMVRMGIHPGIDRRPRRGGPSMQWCGLLPLHKGPTHDWRGFDTDGNTWIPEREGSPKGPGDKGNRSAYLWGGRPGRKLFGRRLSHSLPCVEDLE